ncbi:MAG: winged helix-turn-helix transcriptional regulator [Clostridia bacterium]|nr:winged helix-turn-helix transcriptional regulator [Clostridia bacterium]
MPNNRDFAKNVVSLIARLQNLCEGFDDTNKSAVITAKVKILLELSKADSVTPTVLKRSVGLAKSNVALICGKLIEEGLVSKSKDSFDTREIFYSITDKGKKCLDEFLAKAQRNFESELAYKNNIKQIDAAIISLLQLVE